MTIEGYYIEDMEVGMSAVFGKTITEADIVMFCAISGDTNPIHIDEEYAASTPFGGRIAHGMLTGALISTVLGTKLPGPGAIYVSQSLHFKAPVRAGHTVQTKVTVREVDRQRRRVTFDTICTVAGKVVLEGEAVIMAPRRAAKPETVAA